MLSPLSAGVLAVDRNTLATQYVTGRTSNSVLYKSPSLAGFQLYALYGLAATVTQPIPQTADNTLDLAATYSGYGTYAAIAYQYQHPGIATIKVLPTTLNLPAPNTTRARSVIASVSCIFSLTTHITDPKMRRPVRSRRCSVWDEHTA